MLTTEIKEQFILLRAENKSYSQIVDKLHISKSSCIKLSKELNSEIAQRKADRLQGLYNDYFMTKEARIKNLGETLLKIDNALMDADLSELSPRELLDFKLKYSQALKEEFIPVSTEQPIEVNEDAPEGYTESLKALLARSRTTLDLGTGLTTTELNRELLLLEKIHKAEKESGPTEDRGEALTTEQRIELFNSLMGYGPDQEKEEAVK